MQHNGPTCTCVLNVRNLLNDLLASAVKVRMGAPKKRARESSAFDAESMGAPGRSTNAQSDPLAALGDAGMVLRDPATVRLIIHHVSLLSDRVMSLCNASCLANGALFGQLAADMLLAGHCDTCHHTAHHPSCEPASQPHSIPA